MKYKNMIAVGLASIALLGSSSTIVNAASNENWIVISRKVPVYNKKGKKIYYGHGRYRHFAKANKGEVHTVLSEIKIKNKKYYEIQKNVFIKASNTKSEYQINKNKDVEKTQLWQSKHLVDTLPSLVDQIKKAFTLQGEDRLEADKEIAVKLNMSPNSVTASNQAEFEQKLQSYVGSGDSAKNWIEQGDK